MAIGLRTAEQVKINVGAAINNLEEIPEPMMVKGKDMIEGLPKTRKIDHYEVVSILDKLIASIEHGIVQTLEVCPPELAADIYDNGIHVTGGNAMLRGLRERFQAKIKLPVHIDDEPLLSVGKGIGATLADTKRYKNVLME
jgi:rod shape-determining protein MreB